MISVAASRGFRFGWLWSRSTLVRRSARSVSVIISAAFLVWFCLRPGTRRVTPARALRRALIAPFGQKLESQRARDRRGLDQLDGDMVAEPIALAGVVADQCVARLVIAVIVVADGACRNEA